MEYLIIQEARYRAAGWQPAELSKQNNRIGRRSRRTKTDNTDEKLNNFVAK